MSVIRSVGAVLAAVAMSLLAAPVASSQTYVVESCRTADGPVPIGAWRAEPITLSAPSSDPLVQDACAHDGVHFLADPLLAGRAVGVKWTFHAPPGTSVAALSLRRFATLPGDHRADYGVLVGDRFLERSPARGPWAFGTPDVAGELRADGLQGTDVAVVFGCFPEGSGCPGAGWKLVVARAAVTLRDEAAPQVADGPAGGSLAARPLAGSVDLRVRYTDVGGGVDTIELLVDGRTHAAHRVGGPSCAAPYVVAVPCSPAGELTMTLDTAGLGLGRHRVHLLLTDAAGNRTLAGPYDIDVQRPLINSPTSEGFPGPPPPRSGQPLGTLLLRGATTRRVKFSPQTLAGTVRGPDGRAVAGGRVELRARPLRGGAWSEPTVGATDRNGRFTFTLPAGPSRKVRLAYGTSARTIRVIVAAPIRLRTDRKATRNGRTLRFSGTVLGAGAARTRVELQAWAGRKWVPFRTTALKNGRFKASYRFTSTYQTTRYRFRAVVHASGDFPYASGKSPVVSVVVRP